MSPITQFASKYLLAILGCIGQALSSIVEWILARNPIHLAKLWLFAILAISFLASLVGWAHSYFNDQLYRLGALASFCSRALNPNDTWCTQPFSTNPWRGQDVGHAADTKLLPLPIDGPYVSLPDKYALFGTVDSLQASLIAFLNVAVQRLVWL